MRLAAFLLVATVALAARADAPRPYSSKALGFTASFPYEVKEKVEDDGSGFAAGFAPGITYMVGVTPENREIGKTKSTKRQLDDGLAGALEKVHGKLRSQRSIKLGAYPGREAEIDLDGGHATFRAYIVGGRTLIIGVVHADEATLPMSPRDFFGSLRIDRK